MKKVNFYRAVIDLQVLLKNLSFISLICLVILQSGCSPEISSYDEIEMDGKVESIARKDYNEFFDAMKKLELSNENPSGALPDSSLIKKASKLTDDLIDDIRPFPSTIESRIALDAISYAACDLVTSSSFSRSEVSDFWEYALLKPLFSFGKNFMKSDTINESAHLQLLKAFRRGMSSEATQDMLVDCIQVVGVRPSQKVMEFCNTDTLVFKRIHDLILYTRSLQKVDPPLWMLPGPWFLSFEFNNMPGFFISLVPVMVDDVPYFAFKSFNQGDVYSAVFDDPSPTDDSKMDAWLARAYAVMSSLKFDDSIADRVQNSGLTSDDSHYYYSDYLLHTDADTTKKVFWISFTRKKIQGGNFQFAGMDSITVTFNSSQVARPDGKITRLSVTRFLGSSIQGGRFIPSQTLEGTAYLMPIGIHESISRRRSSDIKIGFETKSPNAQ